MPRPLPRPPVKSIINLGQKILPLICPNPNVSITFPPRLTFNCR
jgi:hypothetical protein